MEREHERGWEDCLGQGKAEEGNPRRCSGVRTFNVFNGQTCTFDYCACMIGQHSVGAVLLDLNCKPVVCCLSVSWA